MRPSDRNKEATLRLAVLYQQYDPIKYGPALDRLRAYLRAIPFCRVTYVVIDNKTEGAPLRQSGPDTFEIGGDNSIREFSAWQRGLEALRTWPHGFSAVLVCNEAFLAPGESYLRDYARSAMFRASVLNTAIGRVDTYHQPVEAFGLATSRWLCTNAVFLPGSVVSRLDTVVSVDNQAIDRVVPSRYDPACFRADAPISPRYRELILEWLTARWHSRFEINEASWALFRTKVQAILNESLLTARLRALGYRIGSYGWKKYY